MSSSAVESKGGRSISESDVDYTAAPNPRQKTAESKGAESMERIVGAVKESRACRKDCGHGHDILAAVRTRAIYEAREDSVVAL